MVNVVGNGIGTPSSNLVCISLYTDILGKGKNPSVSSLAIDKLYGKLNSLTIVWQSV